MKRLSAVLLVIALITSICNPIQNAFAVEVAHNIDLEKKYEVTIESNSITKINYKISKNDSYIIAFSKKSGAGENCRTSLMWGLATKSITSEAGGCNFSVLFGSIVGQSKNVLGTNSIFLKTENEIGSGTYEIVIHQYLNIPEVKKDNSELRVTSKDAFCQFNCFPIIYKVNVQKGKSLNFTITKNNSTDSLPLNATFHEPLNSNSCGRYCSIREYGKWNYNPQSSGIGYLLFNIYIDENLNPVPLTLNLKVSQNLDSDSSPSSPKAKTTAPVPPTVSELPQTVQISNVGYFKNDEIVTLIYYGDLNDKKSKPTGVMFSIADIESAGTKTLIGAAQLLTTKDVTGSEKANCAIYPQNKKFYQCTVRFNPTDNGLMPKKGINFYAETYNSIGTSILSKPMNLYPSLGLESFAQCIYSAQHDTGKEIVLIFTGILSDLASTVAIDKIDSSLKLGYKVYEKGILKTNLAFIPNLVLNGDAKETSKESLKSFTPDMAFDVLKTYRLKYGNVLFSDGEYAWQIGDVSESSSRFKRVSKASGLATLASGAIDLYLIKQKSNLRISSCELSSNN